MRKSKKIQQYPARRQPRPTAGNTRVFSYYAKRSVRSDGTHSSRRYQETPPKTPLLRRQWIRDLPSLVALCIVLVSLVYCLGLDTRPSIQIVSETPQSIILRNKTAYQHGAQTIMGKPFLNHSKLTIDTAAFAREFMKEFPEVSDVSVTLPFVGRRPVVTIDTAQPVLRLASAGTVYVLDSRGKAIIHAEDIPSSLRQTLPLVSDEAGFSVAVGKAVLPPDHIQFILGVAQQLKAQKLPVQSLVLPALAQELHVRIEGQPYYVKYNVAGDARIAVGSYLAVKERLDREGNRPAQYIDVRIDERVYVK